MAENVKKKKLSVGIIFARIGIFLLVTLVMAVVAVISAAATVAKGPSESAKKLFVRSVKETSAIGFLADWFFSDDEIAAIVGNGRNSDVDEATDSNLIKINLNSDDAAGAAGAADGTNDENKPVEKDMELVDIIGSSYKGKLLIVKDPSRVFIGVSGDLGSGAEGKPVADMIESYGAVAGTNAGGFEDAGGRGNGGTPLGIVISQGKLEFGSLDQTYEIIGFDNDNILHVGKMTAQQALDNGIRDAVCFGPILIVNGKPCNSENPLGGGLNPRTAIGQRADGAVLILVIDGRQASSLGATYDDLVEVMDQYGAVNAANLDGGSSSNLIYNGELVTECSSLYGPRKLPTAVLVK